MMGSSDSSYNWQGGTAVGGSFTNDGATKNKCNNQPNKRLDDFRQDEEDGCTAKGVITTMDKGQRQPQAIKDSQLCFVRLDA